MHVEWCIEQSALSSTLMFDDRCWYVPLLWVLWQSADSIWHADYMLTVIFNLVWHTNCQQVCSDLVLSVLTICDQICENQAFGIIINIEISENKFFWLLGWSPFYYIKCLTNILPIRSFLQRGLETYLC